MSQLVFLSIYCVLPQKSDYIEISMSYIQPGLDTGGTRNWITTFFSQKGGLFWNVAAGAALLSAGYVAAKFSSGEEEYRESLHQQIPLERSDSVGGGPMVHRLREQETCT